MKLSIRSHGWDSDADLREYIERRLHFALGRIAPRVRSVTAYLEDVNGPRGGLDKRCRLLARMSHGGEVVVEDTGAEPLELIDRVANRLGRVAIREVDRQRMYRPAEPEQVVTE